MPVYKYQDTAGHTKWYASFYFTDWQGKRKRKLKRGFATKREAQEFERTFLNSEATDPDIMFPALVENYFNDNEMRLKPTTKSNKEFLVARFVTPYFKDLAVKDITPLSIHKWQNEIMAMKKPNGEHYAQSYLKSIDDQMGTLMAYAVRFYRLKYNPCDLAENMGSSESAEMKIWTQDQFQHFLSFELRPTYHLVFDILFYTGMRIGECLALTPEDILDTKAIRINKNYQKVGGIEYYLTPKTEKGERTVTIPASLYDELTAYIRDLSIDTQERLFYFGRQAVELEIKAIAKKAGMEPIRVHDLRHSHASMLIQMKYNILAISKRLGHKNPETTYKTYAHLYPHTDDILANDLNSVRLGEISIENKNPAE